MGNSTPYPILTWPYPIWSAWRYLTDFEQLFLVAMGALTVYFLFSAGVTIAFCRECRTGRHKGDGAYVHRTVAALRKRCTRLRRLLETALCLFGVVFFWACYRPTSLLKIAVIRRSDTLYQRTSKYILSSPLMCFSSSSSCICSDGLSRTALMHAPLNLS
jgi:hypothetical protein